MKKIISSVLVIIMLMSLSCPLCFASVPEGKIRFYSNDINVSSGEDFILEIFVENNPGICAYMISLEYDKALLNVEPDDGSERAVWGTSVINGIGIYNDTYKENAVSVVVANAENSFEDGEVLSFRFTVNEVLEKKDTKVKVVLESVSHFDDNEGTFEAYDIFEAKYSEPVSYDVTVKINDEFSIDSVSSVELDYETEEEFKERYEEELENNEEAKPTPKPIYRPDGGGGSPVTKTPQLKKNSDVSSYMAPESETKFAPDRYATRYEVVGALANVFTVENASEKDDFSDVDEEYKKAVNDFSQVGVITGYEDETFKGENSITRAEAVKLLAIAFNVKAGSLKETELSDVSGHWAEEYINAFTQNGYILGYPDNTFRPDSNITRAEVVAILNRLLDIKEKEGVSPVFEDLDPLHWAYNTIMSTF